ncbi:hypothetical protein [Thermasporomyces composti]|jgi:hypothetical protein|uniref:Nitroreductase family protein n=1 Tax=Thermasporomyces composti TaxID=696763 RepID=A0A3D9V9D2_THECX|nr:hypothetical protein [Thermasporomyces composti]REF38099.1 hypothetical protein DFJ64_3569 [Thermasporomyces composti]
MPRPHTLTAEEQRFVTEVASHAPAILGTPWRVAFAAGRVEVWADGDPRAEPARLVALACGTATYDACLALRVIGREAWVHVQPEPATPALCAVVRVGTRRAAGVEDLAQYHAIALPRIDDRRHRSGPLPFSLITRLEGEAGVEGALLDVLSTAEADEIGRILTELRRVQGGEATAGRPRDGEGARTGSWSDGLATSYQVGRRTLAVLSTPGDSEKDRIRAGMAMERVLLVAAMHGVVASVINAPVEVLSSGGPLRFAASPDCPQVVVELGYARASGAETARVPVQVTGTTGRSSA